MKRFFRLTCLTVIALGAFSLVAQSVLTNQRRLVVVNGNPVVSGVSRSKPFNTKPGEKVAENENIWCEKGTSTVALDFQNGLVTCSQGTRYRVLRLGQRAFEPHTVLQLQEGAIQSSLTSNPGTPLPSFEIINPSGTVSVAVKGTQFTARLSNSGNLIVNNLSGQVQVRSETTDRSVIINTGQSVVTFPDGQISNIIDERSKTGIENLEVRTDGGLTWIKGRVEPTDLLETEYGEVKLNSDGSFAVGLPINKENVKYLFLSTGKATVKKVVSVNVKG